MKKKILITGASGFVGSFLVEEGLRLGMDVWAGMRATSSRRYLGDDRIHFALLDLGSYDKLLEQLSTHKEKYGAWDYVVHCAGVTKCLDRQEFFNTNTEGTKNLVNALVELDMVPRQFVYISTLSVFGPAHEYDYSMINDSDKPCPDTVYGESKRRSEEFLEGISDFPFVVFRPTGVYGPREKDYFMMAESIKKHIDFAVGYKKQIITFIYVKDLVKAVYMAIEKGVTRKFYILSDGCDYSSRAFSDLLRKELGNPWLLRIKAPLWLLYIVSCIAESFSHITGRPSTLNRDKYRIMKQRNWRCDISGAERELDFRPEYNLERGVRECVEWYKKEGWI